MEFKFKLFHYLNQYSVRLKETLEQLFDFSNEARQIKMCNHEYNNN